jgi:hypothetical protein
MKMMQNYLIKKLFFLQLFIAFGIAFLFSFPVHAQRSNTKDVIPILECVEYIGNGNFKASFGYDNPNTKEVSISQDNSVLDYKNGKKLNAVNTFKTGRQSSVFSASFNQKEVVEWTIILPSGEVQVVRASANSALCKNSATPPYNGPNGGDNNGDDDIIPLIPDPGYKTEPDDKIGGELDILGRKGVDSIRINNVFQTLTINGIDYVLIEVISKYNNNQSQFASLRSHLDNTYGMKDTIQNEVLTYIITGFFPVDDLLELNDIAEINYVRPLYRPISNSGRVLSEGDKAQLSDIARKIFDVDGSGITVGVLSDSYNKNNQISTRAIDDVNNGELPNNVKVFDDRYPSLLNPSDEGRAMLQIVHDVAPGANLAFHTGFLSPENFATGIRKLAQEGSNIIVDDITYVTEPFLRDGNVAKAVNDVTAAGVAYFTSAGNFGSKSHSQVFNPYSNIDSVAHNFGGGNNDILQKMNLSKGDYTIVLQWDDDFYSLGQGTGAKNDLDIYLTDENGKIQVGFARNNIGKDPIEVLSFSVLKDGVVKNIAVSRARGTGNVNFKYIIFRGEPGVIEYQQGTSTIAGHANAEGAITVGAVRYNNTALDKVEDFSSRGGTLINGVDRMKPDISAPNGGVTTIPLGQAERSPGAFPFFGTSAAAPHAAAVAALIMQAKKDFDGETTSPADIRSLLSANAVNMYTSGHDYNSGYGFIQAHTSILSFANPKPILSDLNYELYDEDGNLIEEEPIFGKKYKVKLKLKGDYFKGDAIVVLNKDKSDRQEYVPTKKGAIGENGYYNELEIEIPELTGNPSINVYNPPRTTDGGYSDTKYLIPLLQVTITASDVTKKFGQSLPGLTYTIEAGIITDADLIPGLDLTGLVIRTNANEIFSNAGTHAIVVDTTGLSKEVRAAFEIVPVNGTLTIEKLNLSITPKGDYPAGKEAFVYGDEIKVKYEYEVDLDADSKQTVIDRISSSYEESLYESGLGLVNSRNMSIVNGRGMSIVNGRGMSIVNGQLNINEYSVFLVHESALGKYDDRNGAFILDVEEDEVDMIYYEEEDGSLIELAAVVNSRNLSIVNSRNLSIVNSRNLSIVNSRNLSIVNSRNLSIVNSRNLSIVNSRNPSIVNSDADSGDLYEELYLVVQLVEEGEDENISSEDDEWLGFKFLSLTTGATPEVQQIIPAPFAFDAIAANFFTSYEVGEIHIDKAPLAVTVKDEVIRAGHDLPQFTYQIEGYKLDDSFESLESFQIVVPDYEGSAGKYSISADLTSNNYYVREVSGTLFVNPYGDDIKSIKPVLDCVDETGETEFPYVAYFSYNNTNAETVYVFNPADNYIAGEAKFDRNVKLPTTFAPGTGKFSVKFDGARMAWYLTTFDGEKRTSTVSQASSGSARCKKALSTESFSVFPNPFQNKLSVKSSEFNLQSNNIKLYDLSERLLNVKVVLTSGGVDIDTSRLQAGFYI